MGKKLKPEFPTQVSLYLFPVQSLFYLCETTCSQVWRGENINIQFLLKSWWLTVWTILDITINDSDRVTHDTLHAIGNWKARSVLDLPETFKI